MNADGCLVGSVSRTGKGSVMAMLRLEGPPTAQMLAAYAICKFAYGSGMCMCSKNRTEPCEAIRPVARLIIAVAKNELAETHVLRKKPIKRKER